MALMEYKCPNCAGPLTYEPGTRDMVCPYCNSVVSIESLEAMDAILEEAEESESQDWSYAGNAWQQGEQEGMAVYACNSCGGEIIGDESLGATACPFCGNRIVISSKFAGSLRPDLVVPFKLTKEEAKKALERHYLGKRLLPKVFRDKNHLDEVKGVYVPFWLFDAETGVKADYEASKTKRWSDSHFYYTETSHYHVHREGSMVFDQVPVDGSQAIDDTLMESLEPYDLKEAVDFQTAYLAGYFANKYDVAAESCFPRADERIQRSAKQAFRNTVRGYQTVNPKREEVSLTGSRVTYALLPVYLLSTSWENRNYLFAMNGQTGKLVGDLPLDKRAYRSWFFKIFSIAALILVAISQLLVK
ncbi:MAG: hypothetical protein GX839_03990 [Fastidiosipila sp.]|jgi:DNA-directed RNA polymerase subunit RPC12/RpoP|nr:hypothetical protein [Fastidiosipila sp.]